MSSDRDWFFEELDGYTRKQYQCFVAEMFLSEDQGEYVVCFRPIRAVRGSPDQYACRYLRIDAQAVKDAHLGQQFPNSITEKLEQLKVLG